MVFLTNQKNRQINYEYGNTTKILYFGNLFKVQFNSSILGLVFTLFSEGNFNLNFES